MLKKIAVIGALFLAFAWSAAIGLAAAGEDMSVYENGRYGFTLQYPARWLMKEGIMNSVVAFMSSAEPPGTPHFNANVVVEDVGSRPGLTLEQYCQASIAQFARNSQDFRLADNQPGTLSGQPARILTYGFKQAGYDFSVVQAVTIYNNKAFIIIAGTEKGLFAKYEAAARAMIESFAFSRP